MDPVDLSLFFHLNDDVWMYIIKVLPLRDHVMMAQTCDRFYDLAQHRIKMRFRYHNITTVCNTSNMFRRFTFHDYRIMLPLVAPQLLTIILDLLINEHSLELISIFLRVSYPNLRTLDIAATFLNDIDMALIARNCPVLDELVINNCEQVSGAHLQRLRKLRKLQLTNCPVTAQHLRELLDGRLTELEHLDLSGYLAIRPPLAQLLSVELRMKLTHLNVSPRVLSQSFVRCLLQMPNLQNLYWNLKALEEMSPRYMDNWFYFYQHFGPRIVEMTCQNIDEDYFFDSIAAGAGVRFFGALRKLHMVGFMQRNPVHSIPTYLRESPLVELYISDETDSSYNANRRVLPSEWRHLIFTFEDLQSITIKLQTHTVESVMELFKDAFENRLMREIIEKLSITIIDSRQFVSVYLDFLRRIYQNPMFPCYQELLKIKICYEHHNPTSDYSFISYRFNIDQN